MSAHLRLSPSVSDGPFVADLARAFSELVGRVERLEDFARRLGGKPCEDCGAFVACAANEQRLTFQGQRRCIACVRGWLDRMWANDGPEWDAFTGPRLRASLLELAEAALSVPALAAPAKRAFLAVEGDEGEALRAAWTAARIAVSDLAEQRAGVL